MTKETRIRMGHKQGLTDTELAAFAGVSVSTVKRVRARTGLEANRVSDAQNMNGVQYVARQAAALGLPVSSPPVGCQYDLIVNGRRVVVRTLRPTQGGVFQYQLPKGWRSAGGAAYFQGGAWDADVVVLVCLRPDGDPVAFVFDAGEFPASVRIGRQNAYEAHRERWDALSTKKAA